MAKIVLGLLLFFFISLNIASADDILGIHTIEDVTNYNSSTEYQLSDYGYVIPQSVVYEIDTSETTTLDVNTDTWNVSIVATEIDFDTTRITISITNHTGDTSSETKDLYHLKMFGNTPAIEILFSAEGYYDTGVTVNTGWLLWEYEFSDVMLYPSTWIAIVSDGPVSLEYKIVTMTAAIEKAEEGFHPILAAIRAIPIVGDMLADVVISIGVIINVFIGVVFFAITGWAILFLLFETFVCAHGIAVMKAAGGGIAGITGVFAVIASDNYIMIMFVINAVTKMFTMLIDLAKMLRDMVPFI